MNRPVTLIALCLLAGWSSACDPMDAPMADPSAETADASVDGEPLDMTPDEVPDMASDMASDMAPDAMPERLDWQPCDGLMGQPDPRVTCATPEMPLRRDAADDRTTPLFVKRVVGADPDGRSLWLLAGGPGQAGDALEFLADLVTTLDPGLVAYLPDHRGTGRSARLTCPAQETPESPGGEYIIGDEWSACFDTLVERYGVDGLRGFSSHEAAADLVELIDRAGDPHPFVIGISYGTFLAHQYLLLAPDQADGVILDSACDPLDCRLSEQDLWEDRVGRLWLDEVCGADPLCAEKMGDQPTAVVEQLYRDLAAGHCPELAGDPIAAAEATRALLAQMMFFASLRSALPAFVSRIRRCDPADIAAINHMFENVFGGNQPPAGPGSYSFPLAVNILIAEMWEAPAPSAAEIEARYQGTLMCRGVSRQFVDYIAPWSVYDPPLAGQRAAPESPTLVLQAEYDPATPLDLLGPLLADFTGPTGYVALVPHASHSVVSQSQMAASPQGPTCGMQILLAFLADPTVAPATDCLEGVVPPNFAGSPGYNQAVFGTADLWEN